MADPKLLSKQETDALVGQLQSLLSGGGSAVINVASYWSSELRWARNEASMTADRRNVQVFVGRNIRGGAGSAATNQTDLESLRGVVRSAERQALAHADQRMTDRKLDPTPRASLPSTTWSDATIDRSVEESAKVVQQLTESAAAHNLMSSGYVETRGMTVGMRFIDVHGRSVPTYGEISQAQCSLTVRHPKGTGSGWAGVVNYDVHKVDEAAIAQRALDKCLRSLDPVRIEPGRYTTILEAQAVADLSNALFDEQGGALFRNAAENRSFRSPFWMMHDESVGRDRSKLGQRVIDERITVSHDPSDPELGVIPMPGLAPVTWIERGVLKNLSYSPEYALNELNQVNFNDRRAPYRMTGGTTSVEQMIETTQRGLLVTRLSGVRVLDNTSMLSTGVTRDGLWLIERGKITKAVRNFRFTESPLFALNNVVELGVPVPVFHPFEHPEFAALMPAFALSQVIVPPMKVNDFSFTSTIDAV